MQEEKGTAPPNTAFQSEASCLDSYRSLETIWKVLPAFAPQIHCLTVALALSTDMLSIVVHVSTRFIPDSLLEVPERLLAMRMVDCRPMGTDLWDNGS